MNTELARYNMVEQQIRPCKVVNQVLINTLFTIKRENFVSTQYKNLAFVDCGLPLPGGQTMLSPICESKLVEELNPHKTDKVLEIGTGSGYVTALLASLSSYVYSIEIDETNYEFAKQNLHLAKINNVSLVAGNGLIGLEKYAPFDKIFVGGALESMSEELTHQLKIGGKLVGFIGINPVIHAVVIERLGSTEFATKYLFETQVDYLLPHLLTKFKF